MKKLTLKQKLRQIRHQYKRKRNVFAPDICSQVRDLKQACPAVKLHYHKGRITITAPQILRLRVSYEEVIQFLHCIRESANIKSSSFYVDFTTIKEMSPRCAMLLASEVHRLQLIKNRKLRIFESEKWEPATKALLCQIGIFDLVKCNHSFVESKNSNALNEAQNKYIRIRSGQKVDLEKAIQNIEQEISEVEGILKLQIYGAIEEAITNVTQWAYGETKDAKTCSNIYNRWWFFVAYNKFKSKATIMVYDHGVGIAETCLYRAG